MTAVGSDDGTGHDGDHNGGYGANGDEGDGGGDGRDDGDDDDEHHRGDGGCGKQKTTRVVTVV